MNENDFLKKSQKQTFNFFDIFKILKDANKTMWEELSSSKVWEELTSTEEFDLQEKREIYQNIALFLQELFKIDFQEISFENYLKVTHNICNESNPKIITEDSLSESNENLAFEIKKCLQTINVDYFKFEIMPTINKNKKGKYVRRITISYKNYNESIKNDFYTEKELAWDDLPSEVRKDFIQKDLSSVSKDLSPVSFELYSQEN